MIQFNLLPDVKVEYIKTQRLKRMVLVISLAIMAFSVGLLIILFSFQTVQKKHLSDLDKDIAKITNELNSTPDLTRILSIQNQLNALSGLYDSRPAVDRLPGYVDQITPTGVTVGELSLDFGLSTVKISGGADSLEKVNAYVDTIKYTSYQIVENGTAVGDPTPAFTGVVLTEFEKTDKPSAGEAATTYIINFSFDPLIFSGTQVVKLSTPNLVTTRIQAPSADLFKKLVPIGGEQ